MHTKEIDRRARLARLALARRVKHHYRRMSETPRKSGLSDWLALNENNQSQR